MYDLSTLTMYGAAALLSFSLGLVLITFAYFQPGTVVCRPIAVAILVASAGYFFSGYGPLFPAWVTVIGTNSVILMTLPLMHAAYVAYASDRQATVDRFGWLLIAAVVPLFAYWGLVEPDGIMRSYVFSVVAGVLSARTAWQLIRAPQTGHTARPLKIIGLLFACMAATMAVRIGFLAVADPPPQQRGANPTTWGAVAMYVLVVSAMVGSTLWLELRRLGLLAAGSGGSKIAQPSAVSPMRAKLVLLWSGVFILGAAVLGEIGIAYSSMFDTERDSLHESARLALDAATESVSHTLGQVDVILRGTRTFHLQGRAAADTERYVEDLHIHDGLIEDVYLIDAGGRLILPLRDVAKGNNFSDRDYFEFHRSNASDALHIGPVQRGYITGKHQFRVSRRLTDGSGRFAGVILVPVEPQRIAAQFAQLKFSDDFIIALIDMRDHRLRARIPQPNEGEWSVIIESPLWSLSAEAPTGLYRSRSSVDGIDRELRFQRLGNHPLVLVTGFSDGDVHRRVLTRMRPLVGGAVAAVTVIALLAGLLTRILRERDEQDRFLAMLSHEMKTPLSVIRLSLGIGDMPEATRTRLTQAVKDMNAIIERTVQSDQLRHGKLQPYREQCDLAAAIDLVVRESADPARIRVRAEALPACITDPLLLRTILANLIDNALKYGRPGTDIDVEAEPALYRRREGIRVIVGNEVGPAGIPDRKRAFERYFRAPSARSKSGSGLGLYIADGFARQLGGRLELLAGDNRVKFALWIPL